DRGVAAERHDAAARTAEVAEQELQQRAAADDLYAVGVLGPGDRVGERAGPVSTRVRQERLGHLDDLLLRRAADPLHHLRRVAAVVPLEELEHAVWVLQRGVLVGGARPERAHEVVERRAGAPGDEVL